MQTLVPDKYIQTRALVVENPQGPFLLRDIILDEVRDDEVLVEIKYSGLCHTVCISHGVVIDICLN